MSTEIPLDELQREALAPTDDALISIAELIERQIVVEDHIASLEKQLKKSSETLARLSGFEIPTALQACGLTEIKSADGSKVTCKEFVRASITKKNQPEAFAWLEDNGHGDLIKNVISASFGKGEDDDAQFALTKLEELGATPTAKRSVATQTLGAFVREQRAEGNDVPEDLLGVFVGYKTKIERSK